MNIDDLNSIAWRDFIAWAFSQKDMRQAFYKDTGHSLGFGTANPIEILIDEACGVAENNAAAFIRWATKKHWGLEYAPKSYQKHIAEENANALV